MEAKAATQHMQQEIKARLSKSNDNTRVPSCGYCYATESDTIKLMRCPCKTAYYCCKDHQRFAYEYHKTECRRIRGGQPK